MHSSLTQFWLGFDSVLTRFWLDFNFMLILIGSSFKKRCPASWDDSVLQIWNKARKSTFISKNVIMTTKEKSISWWTKSFRFQSLKFHFPASFSVFSILEKYERSRLTEAFSRPTKSEGTTSGTSSQELGTSIVLLLMSRHYLQKKHVNLLRVLADRPLAVPWVNRCRFNWLFLRALYTVNDVAGT